MRLGWDEIARRAKAFSEEWADAHYEKGETQSFYNDFFEVFGIKRRQVAVYEQRVKLLDNKQGFIDLFWPRTLLIEQKSAGLKLGRAQGQALDYLHGVHPTEQPRFILTCDFQRWNLLDLESGKELRFALCNLHKHVQAFDFMLGRRVSFERQEAVTIKAAELMGRIHDALEENGYTGHDLERYLVRLLFCMFADDTGIFQPKDIFLQLIEHDTNPDGSNVGRVINELFEVLDTPEDGRQANLPGELNQFPYVNGRLFRENLRTPVFTQKMRDDLLDACRHDWSAVSPAIFGSLFQSVMDADERRARGAHYTSEENILKVIGPLFLDALRDELEKLKSRKTSRDKELDSFLGRLSRLRFIDPACGCGNFLVIAYREIRRLELEALEARWPKARTDMGEDARQGILDPSLLSRVTVDQFYGIEYEEFPAMIAEVAMWMADHIANNAFNESFSVNIARIPLSGGATIRHGDALEVDWNDVLPAEKCSFVMGNPPFVGAKYQSKEQREHVRAIADLGGSGGTLDYVAAWFLKAGAYLQANKRIRIAFVSTNSITQGEQVAQLWPLLFDRYGLEIAFAHRTFSWGSEARGKAHVHVVIIGLAHRDFEPKEKRLFSYPDIKSDPVESRHGALTAYLFDAAKASDPHLVVKSASKPINSAPNLVIGSKPVDGGYFIFTPQELSRLLDEAPDAGNYVRPFLGAHEYLNGAIRYIIDIEAIAPDVLRNIPQLKERVSKVRDWRAGKIASKASKNGKDRSSESTRPLADFPTKFHVTVIPKAGYLIVPENGSARREYVPVGWGKAPTIPSSLVRVAEDAEIWHFGILASELHMAWVNHIGGRLKSDPRYAIGLVYNTFPWPEATEKQRKKIEELAQAVLDAREAHPTSSLADLYDPDTMPANLRKAHAALDKAVDRLYRRAPFESDRDRVEHLFGLYEKLVNPMSDAERQNKRTARKSAKAKA